MPLFRKVSPPSSWFSSSSFCAVLVLYSTVGSGGFLVFGPFCFQIPAKVHVNRLFFVDKRWQSSPDFGFLSFSRSSSFHRLGWWNSSIFCSSPLGKFSAVRRISVPFFLWFALLFLFSRASLFGSFLVIGWAHETLMRGLRAHWVFCPVDDPLPLALSSLRAGTSSSGSRISLGRWVFSQLNVSKSVRFPPTFSCLSRISAEIEISLQGSSFWKSFLLVAYVPVGVDLSEVFPSPTRVIGGFSLWFLFSL